MNPQEHNMAVAGKESYSFRKKLIDKQNSIFFCVNMEKIPII